MPGFTQIHWKWFLNLYIKKKKKNFLNKAQKFPGMCEGKGLTASLHAVGPGLASAGGSGAGG